MPGREEGTLIGPADKSMQILDDVLRAEKSGPMAAGGHGPVQELKKTRKNEIHSLCVISCP